MTWCAHCHQPMSDGSRATWAAHCREVHPHLADAASRSDDWDHEST